MKTLLTLGILSITAVPALADTTIGANTTLVMENDAGMVIQMTDLTGRECDTIMTLLTPRKSQPVIGGYLSNGLTLSGIPTIKQPSSRLSVVKCLTP